MLDYSQHQEGAVIVLAINGRLDAVTAPELRPTIEELVAGDCHYVVFDLAKLTMIDSSGVGAIVSLFKRLRMKDGDVKIARLQGQPKEIFRLLRLDRAFDLFDDLPSAVSSFA